MSTMTLSSADAGAPSVEPGELSRFEYRPLSMLAVVSFVLGLLSAALMLFWFALVIPAVNLVLGTMALMKLRAARGEYGGTNLAIAGLALSGAALTGGILYQVYVYQTEIPAGYTRISFSRDVSDKAKRVLQGMNEMHPDLLALDGQKVFVKGFMYPVEQQRGLKEFLLVKDSGTCCFGGKPELWDMIGVFMSGQASANYYSGRVSVTGTFRLNRQYTGRSEMEPVFVLDGYQVTRSRSDFDPPAAPDFTPAASESASPGEASASTATPVDDRSS
ncbi:MAG: DUF3299 domain-containing protein [Planctomyces sp.]|nr:DUF3299 domain-containing protein [Planctomyces sp.]